MDGGNTYVGKKPAGPQDELELVRRFALALYRGRTLPADDREVVYAIADLLDRVNFLLESTVDLTILAGPQGIFLNGKRRNLPADRADLVDELAKGMAARGLAGVTINAALDQTEVLSFLTAWRLPPVASPRESLARLTEVLNGERSGRGLPETAPLELVKLTASGKLPIPKSAASPADEDDDYVAPTEEDTLDEQQAALARLARRAKEQAATAKPDERPAGRRNQTMVKRVGDVIAEDKAASERVKGSSSPTHAKASESAVRRASESLDGGLTAIRGPDAGKTAVRGSDPGKTAVRGSDPGKTAVRGSDPGKTAVRGGAPGKSPASGEGDRTAVRGPAPKPAPPADEAGPSWLLDDAAPANASPLESALAANDEPAASDKTPPAGTRRDTNEFKNIAASFEAAAEVSERSGSSSAVRPPGSADAPEPSIEEVAGSTAVRKAADVIPDDIVRPVDDEPPPPEEAIEHVAGSTAVRNVSDVIDEDMAARASELDADARAHAEPEVAAEPAPGDELDSSKTPVRLSAPAAGAPIEDLSPESSKAQLAYVRLCARSLAALTAPAAERDRTVSALRRAVVEILNGLAHTAYEDRILALTAMPAGPEDARGQHAGNTAIFTGLAARACGVQRLQLADLMLAAALHDDGDVEATGKADTWSRALGRALEGTISDTSLLRAVLSFERAGPAGAVARPAPQQAKPRLESRLVACACGFDAATRGNEQRAAVAPDLALQRLSPAGHDPIAVKALSAALGKYPRGLLVRLEPRGELGVVLACGGRRGDKPRVRVVADREGQPVSVREVELGAAKNVTVGAVESVAKVAIEPLPHLIAWG